MPIGIRFIEHNGILCKGKGDITGIEIIDANKKIYKTPESIGEIKYQIVDFSDIESVEVSSPDIQKIAAQDAFAAKINPRMLIAVVGQDDIVFGLARMWQAYMDQPSFKTQIFRTIAEAEKWIADELQIS